MTTDADILVRKLLREEFVNRKFAPGQVQFSKSSLKDPHIQAVLAEITKQTGITAQDVMAQVMEKIEKFKPIQAKAPLLYGTIADNIVEDTVFTIFQKHPIKTKGAEFSVPVFNKLMMGIRADHDKFFPLRGFIDQKHLHAPSIYFVGPGHKYPKEYEGVDTAAATPGGAFVFNVPFMQRLMDYAHLKGVRPKGKKYVSNGGQIPDEYAYLEFIIMHEFMHFTEDDFHYHKVIPNASMKIINWVGDFRTNYLLVKSGYEQLPIGLFNDAINYDRQHSYIEMYRLVEAEFDKLNDKEKSDVETDLDGKSDDHEPGNEEGKGSPTGKDGKDANGNPIDPSKIDDKAKKTTDQMKEGADTSTDEADAKNKANQAKQQAAKGGGRGPIGAGEPTQIDYSKIKPRFNWAQLVKRFIFSAKPRTEETYQKPSRKAVSGMHVAAQVGAAAIKPAEVKTDFNEVNLCFVVDSSGSMSGVIEKVYANMHALLKSPGFAKSLFTLIKFSDTFHMYKANFTRNVAGKIDDIMKKPASYDVNLNVLFNQHIGSSTNFTTALVEQLERLMKTKANVLMFLDGDIYTDGGNYTEFVRLLRAAHMQVFVIFDTRDTYIGFRQKSGIATANLTYFEDL